ATHALHTHPTSHALVPHSLSLCSIRAPTPTTNTLPLHDALPISHTVDPERETPRNTAATACANPIPTATPTVGIGFAQAVAAVRSEEHTSELQSRFDIVCRLLLEKKKKPLQPPSHGSA